jgi:hypothetical protein
MEVVAMLLLIVVAVVLAVVAVVFLLPDPDADAPRPTGETAGGDPPSGDRPSPPTTLEGVLAAQLISAEISRDQYRHAVARLAARDDAGNPLSAPGTDRPDACA